MKKLFFLVFGLVIFNTNFIYAQGCSDAGFCTLGALRPNQAYSKKINIKLRSVEISNYLGITQSYIYIYNVSVDLNVSISNKLSAQIKLPYQYVAGGLAKTHGLGDISLSTSYNVLAKENFQINASLGMKIPTSNADKKTTLTDRFGKTRDISLPMYYQTSLGTWDILGGVSVITKNWLFAAGFQHSLTNTPNNFLWKPFDGTADSAKAYHYMKSKQLNRGTDVMLRAERNLRFSNWNVYAGLLAIYRLNEDKFLDGDNKTKEIKGSDGLALTFLMGAGYRFNTHSGIKAMFGYNLKDRTASQIFKTKEITEHKNPDGLSRALVFSLGYEYRF